MHLTSLLIPFLTATTLAIPNNYKPRCMPCELEELAGGVLNGVADVGLPIISGILGGGGGGGVSQAGATTVTSSTQSTGQTAAQPCQPCEAAHGAARMMARGLGLEDQLEGWLYPGKI